MADALTLNDHLNVDSELDVPGALAAWSLRVVPLTQTEYDALDPPDDRTLYVIVEGE